LDATVAEVDGGSAGVVGESAATLELVELLETGESTCAAAELESLAAALVDAAEAAAAAHRRR